MRALYSCENIGLAFWEEVDDLTTAIRLDPNMLGTTFRFFDGCFRLSLTGNP